MPKETDHPLKVFLCHASGDKPQVRVLYKRLVGEGVDAWLDQEKLLPGQDWRVEIPRAVKEADVVVICLSNKSITKEGYVQKEIKFALDIAEEKPEGSIFLIPARLEDCPVPDQMSRWQWVDLFEENGFIRLLRSLKLRADKVGAVIQASSQTEDDQETERRINQLYTEGLAFFYTEEWDKACQRFQTILSERPSHKNAIEKLEESERQRDLAKLYAQATEAYRSEKWEEAIRSLDEISRKSADYKDVSRLIINAKKQRQLRGLYAEAKTLHAAQKWQAVLKVFDQISIIEPSYPDADGLLSSAQKEMAESRRLAELNGLYSNAVHEMDAGHWYEARTLLEQIHKSQIGFLETERLLRKAENEITKLEDQRKRTAQVQVLYDQARKMARSSQWGKAQAQMQEIRNLDSQFADSDGIEAKAKEALAHEEQASQRRKELAAQYAEAVSLLDAKKYQEALEKWNAVQAIDPTYKDTSRVRVTARKKLDELSQPEKREGFKSLSSRVKALLTTPGIDSVTHQAARVEGLILIAVVSIAIIQLAWRFVFVDRLHLFDTVFGGTASLFLLIGLYGTVVALVYKRSISTWNQQSSWTQIIGWAVGGAITIIAGTYFNLANIVFWIWVPLFSALAMKSAKVSLALASIVFVSWGLAWIGGNLLGNYLSPILNTGYIWVIADAIVILLGLLFTLGALAEDHGKILRATIWGALGFAIGNFLTYLPFIERMYLPGELLLTIWGLVGGAILAAPSRNPRQVFLVAIVCGAGLFAGGYVGLHFLPAVIIVLHISLDSNSIFILQQVIFGMGLGLAIGLLIRRPSAIGVLMLLGAGMYMTTRALNVNIFNFDDIWEGTIRGALIGLVLGFGYGLMARGIQEVSKIETIEQRA